MADIELVIKIPEELYNYMQTERYDEHLDKRFDYKIRFAVKDSTPLPKGHGRLIDADDTISKICGSSCGCHLEECGNDKHCYSVTRIESAHTIIQANKREEE